MTKAAVPPRSAEIQVRADDDLENVIVMLSQGGKPSIAIDLDPVSAERLAAIVAKHRARLTDPVAKSLDFNARLDVTPDPVIVTGRSSERGRRLLLLRHPGYGWLTFSLDEEDCSTLAEALVTDKFERA